MQDDFLRWGHSERGRQSVEVLAPSPLSSEFVFHELWDLGPRLSPHWSDFDMATTDAVLDFVRHFCVLWKPHSLATRSLVGFGLDPELLAERGERGTPVCVRKCP